MKLIASLITFIILAIPIVAQNSNEISDQNLQLESIRKRLTTLENQLQEIKINQQTNVNELSILDEKIHLIDKLIEELSKEEIQI